MSKIITVFILIFFVVSCREDAKPLKPGNPKSDTTKPVAAPASVLPPVKGNIDTGSKTTGAGMIKAMRQVAVVKTSFRPSRLLILINKHDTVIEDVSTPSMILSKCYNVTIKNCRIGPGSKPGITLSQCTNINIDSCYLYGVSTGIYAENCKAVSITNCQAKNMMGPFPKGQFVQFRGVSGGGNRVSFNKFENIQGQSYTEDAISLYKCNGLPIDPIRIESNWIRGGGPSKSGGGIMLGDGGGSNQVAKNNILVDPGQYGMAISGGSFMSIVNNTIYAKAASFTNVGLYYRNYTKLPSANICIAKNAVNYTNSKLQLNNTLLGPGEHAPVGWNTNVYKTGLNSSILPASIVSGAIFPSDHQ
jgi:hypothetical protein